MKVTQKALKELAKNFFIEDITNYSDVLEGFDYLIDCFIYEAIKIGGINNEN